MTQNINAKLAKDKDTTPRQIAKSRKRGWITTSDGERRAYTAPAAVHITPPKTGDNKKRKTKATHDNYSDD